MRKAVTTGAASPGDGPYSQGVRAGDFLLVSGQGPLLPTRSCVQAVLDGILVEIDAIAYLGGASGGRGEAAE